MTDGNPLVEKDSQFHLSDYVPDTQALGDGDYGKFAGSYFTGMDNPFSIDSKGQFGDSNGWLTGTGLPDDALTMWKDVAKGDWWAVALDAVTVILDEVGYVTDPGGSAMSAVISWLMEHLKPLKLLMDELAGNGDTVKAVSKTWGNISGALSQAASEYASAVKSDVAGSWSGSGADAYRDTTGKLHDALATCAILADAMQAMVKIASEVVQTVHDTLRDLIASTIADVIEAAMEAPAGPPGWAMIAEEQSGYIARQTSKGVKLVKTLLHVLDEASDMIGAIVTILQEVRKTLPQLKSLAKDARKVAS